MESCLLRTPLVNVQKLLGDGGGGELATDQETCLLRTPLVNVQKLSGGGGGCELSAGQRNRSHGDTSSQNTP